MSKESVAAAIATASTVRTFAEALLPIVEECKWHWNSDGWNVRAVDPANIALLHPVNLSTQAFESYDAPGSATVGVNLTRLLDYLDPADSDQLVELNLNMESRKLELRYENTQSSMALIDPEAIRSEPDNPDLDLPNEIVVEGRDLHHASTVAELTSDHLRIRADPDAREVVFAAEGDTDETTITLGDEDVIDARVAEATESIYSQEYFDDLTSPIPDGAEVTLTVGDEFPLKLYWETLEGHMTVHQMMAPRIKSR